MAYTDDLRCTVYQSDHLISVSGVYYTYTGGAHPNSILMSWNFDLDSGTFFDPNFLEEDGKLKEAVAEELVRQAEEAAKAEAEAEARAQEEALAEAIRQELFQRQMLARMVLAAVIALILSVGLLLLTYLLLKKKR